MIAFAVELDGVVLDYPEEPCEPERIANSAGQEARRQARHEAGGGTAAGSRGRHTAMSAPQRIALADPDRLRDLLNSSRWARGGGEIASSELHSRAGAIRANSSPVIPSAGLATRRVEG